tara:strand:+ start:342 stop:1220 length:879 start_codon:yes stop_codon:yes gene_type:complete
MKFGAPDNLDDLDRLDLSLPKDYADNASLLSGKKKDPKVFVGCSVWGQDPWVGDVYPEGTKKKDYLEEYIRHFNCIELNSTFYNIKKDNMLSWAERAKGSNFKYCPKFNRRISHLKRLKEVEDVTEYFVSMCQQFGDNLGMSFLQMPENFSAKYLDRVEGYLKLIPRDFPIAVELRHPSWFEGEAFDETFEMLSSMGCTAVITDTALKREIIHQRFTNDKVFVRFAAYELHDSNYRRLDEWAERITQWIEQGISEVYFFSKQEDETYAPRQADYFIKKLNALAGLSIKSPYT